MKAPLSWIREYADLPEDVDGRGLADALIRAGLEVETVARPGSDVTGPLVVGRVLDFAVEQHSNGKSIRWCHVDVGEAEPRGIVCGAHNFSSGDFVVVALPGSVLPGGFAIAARSTYGHVSDGMICSARELALGDDHAGILVLTGDDLVPGADAAEALQLHDEVLDIAVTPDRGYCLSIRGLAREAAQAMGVAYTDPVDRPVPLEIADGYPVELAAPACPTFVALTVTGIDPSRPSPRWLARRVQLAGMRSISLVVDITNYVMLETGQPIHAYDRALLDGPIVVRMAAEGEKLTTLDDVVRPLDDDDLVITDGSGPIGLAGTMGGASTEISASTTDVVIEAAHFDAMTVARMSRRHKLSSEASRRFERGVDPAATYAAAHRVAQLLVDLAGGTRSEGETVRGSVLPQPTTVLERRPAGRGARRGDRPRPGGGVDHRDRGAGGGRGPPPDGHRADLAAGPARPLRLRRGGRPTDRLRDHRAGVAAGPRRARADPGAAGTAGRQCRGGRCRLRRGAELLLRLGRGS